MKRFNLIVAILAFATLLICTNDANAFFRRRFVGGGCGNGVVCAQPVIVHADPVVIHAVPIVATPIIHEVITPVAVPIFVPTFQFQYAPPCASVPVAAATGFGYPAYGTAAYSGSAAYGNAYAAAPQQTAYPAAPMQPTYGANANDNKDSIRQLARAILEEMNKESGGGNGQQDDGPPVAILPGQPAPQPQFQPQPQVNGDIVGILRNRCGTCHTGASAKGRFVIFDNFGQLNPQADRAAMFKAVSELRMPEGAAANPNKRLSQAEYNQFAQWATLGR